MLYQVWRWGFEEIDLWELFNPDIFEYVKDGKIWFDPETPTSKSGRTN